LRLRVEGCLVEGAVVDDGTGRGTVAVNAIGACGEHSEGRVAGTKPGCEVERKLLIAASARDGGQGRGQFHRHFAVEIRHTRDDCGEADARVEQVIAAAA